MTRTASLAVLALTLLPHSAFAEDAAWPDIEAALFEGRVLHPAGEAIRLDLPYRTPNDLRTEISALLSAPGGRRIGQMWFVLDNNPMPVSASFAFDLPVPQFYFEATMRVNASTPVHLVMETTDGTLFVKEAAIKTSGTGACSAPPGTDPQEALAHLGEMSLGIAALQDLAVPGRKMNVDMSHPSHSGMQKDQISLLFIPMRYVETLKIDLDGKPFAEMTGSISLSENPNVGLSIPNWAQSADVMLRDTDGTVTRAHIDMPPF